MLYLLGYILGCFFIVTGCGLAVARLHDMSVYRPISKKLRPPPLFKSRALISFSVVLPFTALSFVILTFFGMRIAQSQGAQGHLPFILTALFVPTTCFLIGFFYFKKAVRP